MILRTALLVLLLLVSPAVLADTQAAAPVDLPTAVSTSAAQLKQLTDQRDQIVQQAATASSDAQFLTIDSAAQQLADAVSSFTDGPLQSVFVKLKTESDLLGPMPASGAVADPPTVTVRRVALARLRAQLDDEAAQAKGISDSLSKLHDRILHLQRERLKDQLAFHSNSIVGAGFWAPLLHPDPVDHERLQTFFAQVGAQWSSAWDGGQWRITVVFVVLGLAIWLLLPRLVERAGTWFCMHRLPDGKLRRSTMALATVVASVLGMACLVECLYIGLTHQQELAPSLQTFADALIKLALTCALIAGLGHALLRTRRSTWRMPVIADEVARAMNPYIQILAALLMLSGTIEQINKTADTSLQVTLFGRGLVALVVTLSIGGALIQANRVRNRLAAAGQSPEARSTLTGLIHAAIMLTVVASLIALLGGYITMARFFTYELVWAELVVCVCYLLKQLTQDVLEALLSPRHASGKTLMRLMNVNDARLEQSAIVLTGLTGGLLMLAAVIALLTGGVGTTPTDLIASILGLFGAEKLRSVNVNPTHVLNGIATLAVGFYLVRTTHQWLDRKLLPKTSMGPGMRASLMTLFTNIGYVVVVLVALSALGVQWNSLAWIVSALSVGIGFGLQEIVKNFVSGLILLTERPVKVGDIVSLSGIEGDIRRINVRATEIQLDDRSTVIVPNSQLISQNVRNVTMGNRSLGVVSLTFVFPLDIDPEQVRNLLLDAFKLNESILEQPAPSVTFNHLSRDGITLAVSGVVRSPRVASGVKSDLLFEILKQLRAAGISLSTQQVVQIQRAPQPLEAPKLDE